MIDHEQSQPLTPEEELELANIYANTSNPQDLSKSYETIGELTKSGDGQYDYRAPTEPPAE